MSLRMCARDGCEEAFEYDANSHASTRRFCGDPCQRAQYREDTTPAAPPVHWPEVLMRPLGRWTERAACKDAPPEWFDRPDPADALADPRLARRRQRQAAETCMSCPVRRECADEARTNGWTGVWGGRLFGGMGAASSRKGFDLVDRLGTDFFANTPTGDAA